VLGAEEKPPKAKNDAELAGNNQSDLNALGRDVVPCDAVP